MSPGPLITAQGPIDLLSTLAKNGFSSQGPRETPRAQTAGKEPRKKAGPRAFAGSLPSGDVRQSAFSRCRRDGFVHTLACFLMMSLGSLPLRTVVPRSKNYWYILCFLKFILKSLSALILHLLLSRDVASVACPVVPEIGSSEG